MKEIKDLKTGDEIYIKYFGAWRGYWRKSVVERITPTGLIRANGDLFRQDGYLRGGGARIYPSDDEFAKNEYDKQRKQRFVNSLVEKINKDGMTYEQAVKIKEILEDNKDGKQ